MMQILRPFINSITNSLFLQVSAVSSAGAILIFILVVAW